MALVGDPGWKALLEDGRLVVTGGADAVWFVEDVPASVAAFVERYWSAAPPARDEVPPAALAVVEQLAGLGALRPSSLAASSAGAAAVVFVGDEVDGFRADDVTLVVRTNAPMQALVDVAASMTEPHVLVDLAFHHTVVLGPHVVPGDTACLACLAGRVGARWGDPDPPARPRAVDAAGLAAALAPRAVRSGTLVNATVALDLVSLETRREVLLRSPACPVCGPWWSDGAVPLPWVPA